MIIACARGTTQQKIRLLHSTKHRKGVIGVRAYQVKYPCCFHLGPRCQGCVELPHGAQLVLHLLVSSFGRLELGDVGLGDVVLTLQPALATTATEGTHGVALDGGL